MNRRRFFNALGSAILGTAIALKLPDSLVPTIQTIKDPINDISLRYMKEFLDCAWNVDSPLMARMRNNVIPFAGGKLTNSIFKYRPVVINSKLYNLTIKDV